MNNPFWWLLAFSIGLVMAVTQLAAIIWNHLRNDTAHEGCGVQVFNFSFAVLFIMLTVFAFRHYWLRS